MATPSKTGKNIPLVAERYRVVSNLGAGGMARVELAMDERLDRLVAIKIIHPHLQTNRRLIERFKAEARTVASLHSPYIVEIHDFGRHEGDLFFVMEYIDGQTLNWVLDRLNHEPMDPDVAAAVICQIAEGLTSAVNAGIVHRDLKPENILISSQGYLKITDFGIVHLKDDARLTTTGQVLGTPRFMSPEQVRGKREITYQSDLFSLGVVFYYCLTGRLPFVSESIPGVMAAIAGKPHVPIRDLLPGIDPDLASLVETLLQKEPSRRGGGASWLQAELKQYLFRRGVVDPIIRIREYIVELNKKGIQTFRELDWFDVDIAVKQHNDQKKTRARWAGHSTFRGQVTQFFDLKSKWLWGILLLAFSIAGWLFVYAVQVDVVKVGLLRISKAANKAVSQAATSKTTPTAPPPPVIPDTVSATLEPLFDKTPQRKSVPSYAEPMPQMRHPTPGRDRSKPEAMAQVYVNSTPPYAEVKVGNQSWGFCPISGFKINPGTYRLHISWRKLRSLDTTVQVSAGDNRFQFYLGGE